MVAINKTQQKGDGGETLLEIPNNETTVVSKRSINISRCIGISFVVLLLCFVTIAVGFCLKSERQLPQFCCPCDTLKETSGAVRKGNTCCINTESEYVQTMKHMLNKPEPESKPEGSEGPEDPDAFIAKKEMKMLEARNETITLLHSSPVAAHVLVACTNSTYYQYPQKVQDLPVTRTLMLLPRRSLSLLRGVELRRDHLIIQTKGLYLIYSQIYFKVIQEANWSLQPLQLNLLCHAVERYSMRLPNDGVERLLQSTHILPKRDQPGNTEFDFHTSYISGVFELEVNDEVFVRASLEDVVSGYPNQNLNYIGLIKLDTYRDLLNRQQGRGKGR